ncbi:hypothetical protein B0H19DRAFT_1086203 [Mycena capillaripes]|nr:hypothetical protein B0H19DRAFT_1086203 [Mycena capillaripes]
MGFCTPSAIAFWYLDATTKDHDIQASIIRRALCIQLGRKLHQFHDGTLRREAALQSVPFIIVSDDWTDAVDNAPHIIELPLPYPTASSEEELFRRRLSNISCYGQHLFRPHYDIIAATARDFSWEGQRSSIVHFWQGRSAADGDLNIGPGFFYELPDVIRQTAVGPSGRYMLLLVHKQRDGLGGTNPHGYLGLLHFNPTATPHSTFRKLDIGDFAFLRSDCSRRLSRHGFGC